MGYAIGHLVYGKVVGWTTAYEDLGVGTYIHKEDQRIVDMALRLHELILRLLVEEEKGQDGIRSGKESPRSRRSRRILLRSGCFISLAGY